MATELRDRVLRAFEAAIRGDRVPLLALADEPPAHPPARGMENVLGFRNEVRGVYFGSRSLKSQAGACVVPACQDAPIGSHLLHRACLAHIEEKGHVIEFLPYPDPEQPSEHAVAKPVGTPKFTRFTGFCSQHDSVLFRIIDNADPSDTPSREDMQRWHYRAAASALRHNLDSFEPLMTMLVKVLDSAPSPWFRRMTMEQLLPHYRSASGLRHVVDQAAGVEPLEPDDELVTRSVLLSRYLPMAAAAFCSPWWMFPSGQPFPNGTPNLTLAAVPGPRSARIIMAVQRRYWPTFEGDWAALERTVASGDTSLLFRYVVSTPVMMGVSPTWWNSLSESQRDACSEAVQDARSGRRPVPAGVLPGI